MIDLTPNAGSLKTATVSPAVPGLVAQVSGADIHLKGVPTSYFDGQVEIKGEARNTTSAAVSVNIKVNEDPAPPVVNGSVVDNNAVLTWTIASGSSGFDIWVSETLPVSTAGAPAVSLAGTARTWTDPIGGTSWTRYYVVRNRLGPNHRDSTPTQVRNGTIAYEALMAEYGAVHYWPLDDTASPVRDLGTSPVAGPVQGGAAYRATPLRAGSLGSLNANANNVQVVIDNAALLGMIDQGKSWTIAMWYRTLMTVSDWGILLSMYANPAQGTGRVTLTHKWVQAPGGATRASFVTNHRNQTNLLVLKKDVDAKTYSTFINGAWIRSAVASWSDPVTAGGPLRFPSNYWAGDGYNGLMSDVAMFDYALTDAQIQALAPYSLTPLGPTTS